MSAARRSLVQYLARPLFHACVHLELGNTFADEPAAALDRSGAPQATGRHRIRGDPRGPVRGRSVVPGCERRRRVCGVHRIVPGDELFRAGDAELPFSGHPRLAGGQRRSSGRTSTTGRCFERLPVPGRSSARCGGRTSQGSPVGGGDRVTHLGGIPPDADAGGVCGRRGNQVKAALLHASAGAGGPAEYRVESQAAASAELARLAQRLCEALSLPADEAKDWARALQPLLVPPSIGSRRSKRVCSTICRRPAWSTSDGSIAHRSGGGFCRAANGSCERPLPLLGNALTLRHLRRAHRRVSATRLDGASRRQHYDAVGACLVAC